MAIVFSRPLQLLLASASNPFTNHLETIRLIHLVQSLISERSSRYFVLSDPIVSTFQLSFISNARASMKGRLLRSSHRSCSVKKGVLKSFEACNFTKKESLAQVFSCKFCKLSKSNFFTEHLQTTASDFFIQDLYRKYEKNLQNSCPEILREIHEEHVSCSRFSKKLKANI